MFGIRTETMLRTVLKCQSIVLVYTEKKRAQMPAETKNKKKEQEGQQLQTESAHLTWLYRTVAVQKAFNSETV